MRRIIALAMAPCAALLFLAVAHSQGLRNTPLGFCALSSMSSATLLSSCNGGIPTGTSYAVICAYVQNINWRDDGGTPTGSVGTGGQQIQANNCIPYNGNFLQFQAIQQTSGAILGVTFYRAI